MHLAKGATGAAAAAEEAAEAAAEAQIALYTAGAAVVGGAACSHFFHHMSDEYRNMADNMVPPSWILFTRRTARLFLVQVWRTVVAETELKSC